MSDSEAGPPASFGQKYLRTLLFTWVHMAPAFIVITTWGWGRPLWTDATLEPLLGMPSVRVDVMVLGAVLTCGLLGGSILSASVQWRGIWPTFAVVGPVALGAAAVCAVAGWTTRAFADDPSWGHAALSVALTVAAGAFGFVQVLLGRLPRLRREQGSRGGVIAVSNSARTAWVGRIGSAGTLIGLGALLVVLTVLALIMESNDGFRTVQPWFSIAQVVIIIVCGLPFVIFARVVVTIDRRGMSFRSDVLRLRILSVPLGEIVGVEALWLDAKTWSSNGIAQRSTIVFGADGPGIVVTRRDGTEIALRMDNPDEPAAALTTLMAQRIAHADAAHPAPALPSAP